MEIVTKYARENLPNALSGNLSETFRLDDFRKHAQRLAMLKAIEEIVLLQNA